METIKILIAEHSADVRSYLIQGISALEGVKVLGCSSHPDWLFETITVQKPQIVLLDPVIQGMGTVNVIGRIKAMSNPPIVIALTNFVSEQYRRRAREQGADYFFDKSFEFEHALATVRQVVTLLRKPGGERV